MKRFCILFLLLIVGTHSRAQPVPNGDFETWSTTSRAQNWLTTDDILQAVVGVPVATGTTAKTTDKYAGSFAARLETKNFMGPVALPGLLVLGNSLGSSDKSGGLPFTGRPAALQMRYKLSGTNLAADSAYVGILLTRRAGGQTDTVAEGYLFLRQAAATYTLANVSLRYTSNAAPDSVHIFISSGTADNLTVGTTLTVDDIALIGTTTASRAEAAAAAARLTVFPNPSPYGLITLAASQEPALLQATLTVHDITGRTVLTEPGTAPGTASRTISLRGQPAGVYTLRLATAHGVVTRYVALQ